MWQIMDSDTSRRSRRSTGVVFQQPAEPFVTHDFATFRERENHGFVRFAFSRCIQRPIPQRLMRTFVVVMR